MLRLAIHELPMRALVLTLAFAAALSATSAAYAEETSSTQTASAETASTQPERAEAPTRDGQYVGSLCSRADPYIEYRDCVNAATRDQNAKVRDA